MSGDGGADVVGNLSAIGTAHAREGAFAAGAILRGASVGDRGVSQRPVGSVSILEEGLRSLSVAS
jgi:hypothetical protein